MAEENVTPVAGKEPPPANPLAKPRASTLKLKPVIRKPTIGATALGKPGIRPGMKLPTQPPAATSAPAAAPAPEQQGGGAMEQLKSVTQKLKGVTQEIPQQAILRKTGIIADQDLTEAQKQASKSRTARISLSDALGVAPVQNEAAPIKTIRIKRPVGIPGATSPLKPQPPSPPAVEGAEAKKPEEKPAGEPAPSVTQRKTLKIARPGGGAVRPSGRFGIKRPSHDPTALKKPSAAGGKEDAPAPADGAVADIPDIPDLPMAPMAPVAEASNGPAWLWTLSALVQLAACVAMGALAWFLYENTQTAYF